MNPVKLSKSYAQALKQITSTSNMLKIKESFPALSANQIDWVNNIVKENPKPKPRIQITTKGPFRKQIIVSMSNDNISSFIEVEGVKE